jgi:NMD protein affecting ribosome stability and mRNA decay
MRTGKPFGSCEDCGLDEVELFGGLCEDCECEMFATFWTGD